MAAVAKSYVIIAINGLAGAVRYVIAECDPADGSELILSLSFDKLGDAEAAKAALEAAHS